MKPGDEKYVSPNFIPKRWVGHQQQPLSSGQKSLSKKKVPGAKTSETVAPLYVKVDGTDTKR